MADFTTSKVTGNQVAAVEWNQLADIDNSITSAGITPSTGDLNQIGKSAANYVASSNYWVEGGTSAADVYVVERASGLLFKTPTAYQEGMEVRFLVTNTNTGASTINVGALGVKNIKTIDGGSDPAAGDLTAGDIATLNYDGTNFRVMSSGVSDFVKISSATASASATIDFTNLSGTYNSYVIIANDIAPSVDGASLWLRTSTDNGSTYDSGASDYSWGWQWLQHAVAINANRTADEADSQIVISTAGVGNAANEVYTGQIILFNPAGTGYTFCKFQGISINNTGDPYNNEGSGRRISTADVDAIRFLFSSGNIASGTFTLYGIKA